jgi:hypothetical protein
MHSPESLILDLKKAAASGDGEAEAFLPSFEAWHRSYAAVRSERIADVESSGCPPRLLNGCDQLRA